MAALPDDTGPPLRVRALLARVLPRGVVGESIIGDLDQEFDEISRETGLAPARRWYRWEALKLALRWGVRGSPKAGIASFVDIQLLSLRQVLRSVARAPFFSGVVALTLGLGITAVTTVFAVVEGVVLNPFPFPEPGQLVGVGTAFPRLDRELTFVEHMSPAEYEDIRADARSLERVVAWDMGQRQISVEGTALNLFSGFWWGDAFGTLGVQPAVGRGFLPEETLEGERVAIISWRVWNELFGADPELVGGTAYVNSEPYTLVGVMPPGVLVQGMDLWLPMGVPPAVYERDRRQFQILARLAPDATLETANAELTTLAGRVETAYAREFPEYEGWRLEARTWNDINVATLRPAALALVGAVAFVLMLVCANVTSLFVSRASARRRETAIRSAIGAGRARILWQGLAESLSLAGVAGVVGVGLAYVAVDRINGALASSGLPIPGELSLNGVVLAWTLATTLAVGFVVGLVPSVQAWRDDVAETLQSEGTGVTLSGRRLRIQRVLVGLEVAVCLVLLFGGGLLVNSLARLQAVDPGFQRQDVLTMRLTLARERYAESEIEPFFRELEDRLGGVPGVRSAAVASQFPPLAFARQTFEIEGMPPRDENELPTAFTTIASPAYFETLGTRLLGGRVFDESDEVDAPPVVVVNQAAADRWFPGGDPIGRRVSVGGGRWFSVVGVIQSTRNAGADIPPEPELFASIRQLPGDWNQLFVLAATEGDPYAVLPAAREAIRGIDPDQPVYAIRTIEEAFAQTQAGRRVATLAITAFAVFALLLSALGIYAVTSFTVSERTREIGLRLALGASRGQVIRMIGKQSLRSVALGAAAGVVTAMLFGRLLQGLLFGVGPWDPLTLLGVVLLFGAIAGLATWVPTRRAMRMGPRSALGWGR